MFANAIAEFFWKDFKLALEVFPVVQIQTLLQPGFLCESAAAARGPGSASPPSVSLSDRGKAGIKLYEV